MITLTAPQLRVLGTLLEKEMATPDYYPMTLNSLTTACNQKNNREPVSDYDDAEVLQTLDELRHKGLTVEISGSGRVKKYGHRISNVLNLSNRELALLCVMMLRGAQTVNELRDRTERLFRFDDNEAVEATLHKMIEKQPDPLAIFVPKQAGMREPRYMHLVGGAVDVNAIEEVIVRKTAPAISLDRVAHLEQEVSDLRQRVEKLEAVIAQLM